MKTLQEIILDLNSRGMNCKTIAEKIEHPFSAIYKVQRGDQPSLPYEVGKRIEELHAKIMRKKIRRKS